MLFQACTVVIKGLQGFPKSDIEAIFEEAVGTAPIEVKVIENPNRTRGTAFVKFDTPELARAVSGQEEGGCGEKQKSICKPKKMFLWCCRVFLYNRVSTYIRTCSEEQLTEHPKGERL